MCIRDRPCVNGWLGWQQYFYACNENIVMFFDEDFYTEQKKDKGYVDVYKRQPLL